MNTNKKVISYSICCLLTVESFAKKVDTTSSKKLKEVTIKS